MRRDKKETKRPDRTLIKELKKDGLIDDRFLLRISNLSLEQLITLKLEQIAQTVDGKMYGLNLALCINRIVSSALFRFAETAAGNTSEASILLGISIDEYFSYRKEYFTEQVLREQEREQRTDSRPV